MARSEQDREDLLREATALVPRIELSIPGLFESVTIGFRRDGAASFYFGSDPVYQFNRNKELRRAYRRGRLLKAELGRLVELERVRSRDQIQLIRHELSPPDRDQLVAELRTSLASLKATLELGRFTIVGQVPEDGRAIQMVKLWFHLNLESIVVAQVPNLAG